MVLILSGPIRSYKTTTLVNWISGRTDCGGVLSPDVDGLRRLYNVKEKTSIDWQKKESDSNRDIKIGKFVFDAAAFQKATEWLNGHLNDENLQYLILDEVGPLELSGGGWNNWLKTYLPLSHDKVLIMVVRDTIVDDVIRHYHLDSYKVVSKEYFFDPLPPERGS